MKTNILIRIVKVLYFLSYYSAADVLDVILVNEYPIIRNDNTFSYLKCVTGDGITLSHAPFKRVIDTGSGPHLTSMSLVGPVATGEWKGKKLSMYPEAGLQRTGVFSCNFNENGSARSTLIKTVKIGTGGGIWPELFTKVVNEGDTNVEIIFKSFDIGKKTIWRHQGKVISGQSLVLSLPLVTEDDAGIYECYFEDSKSGTNSRPLDQGIMRLIVRNCPRGKWGPPYCSRKCVCINGGACEYVTGKCVCPPGFWGETCEKACGGNRFGQQCQFHCKQGGSTTGDDAEECKLLQFCLPDPYGCSCATGFKGLECDQGCPVGSYGADCLNECHCRSPDKCNRFTGSCIMGCGAGWKGPSCQQECTTGEWGRNCGQKCHCKDGVVCNRFTGECPGGHCEHPFSGRSCQIDALDECFSNPCQNKGTCIDDILSYTCECIDGITGMNCEIDMDDCLSSPCLNGASCEDDGPKMFNCRCAKGFEGITCEKNIDDCFQNECQNFVSCVDQIGEYKCNCIPGYIGDLCTIPCSPGMYYNSNSKICEPCKVDSYQPQIAKEFCIPCPSGTITKNNGSDHKSKCVSSTMFGMNASSDTLLFVIVGIVASIVFVVATGLIWYFGCHKKKNRLEKVTIRTAW